ncbi:MAG: glutamate racemase [Flavobacteriales bacterium]
MQKSDPIGVFDSGVGGLTVWKELNQLMPNESTIYLADSANAPYGEKPKDQIIEISIKNTERLIAMGAKIIVVACNTATTNAISYIRANYSISFIGIEPATKPAAIATKTGKIGILATKGTLASELFLNTSKQFRGDVEIIETIGTGLVPIIESGNLHDAEELLKYYLGPMVEAGVDNIVLGCTHYPLLIPIIERIIPCEINIVDSGKPVAKQCQRILSENSLLSDSNKFGSHQFFTNADVEILNRFIEVVGAQNFKSSQLDF